MEMSQRMVPNSSGGRSSVKLDDATWKAIEWLAEQSGTTWQRWCAVVAKTTPDGENVTAAIRNAAMSALLDETILKDRGEELALMEAHELMKTSAALNDDQLAESMKGATLHGQSDFGGFSVAFGTDSIGQDCVWIRNGLRNGLHFAFVVPDRSTK